MPVYGLPHDTEQVLNSLLTNHNVCSWSSIHEKNQTDINIKLCKVGVTYYSKTVDYTRKLSTKDRIVQGNKWHDKGLPKKIATEDLEARGLRLPRTDQERTTTYLPTMRETSKHVPYRGLQESAIYQSGVEERTLHTPNAQDKPNMLKVRLGSFETGKRRDSQSKHRQSCAGASEDLTARDTGPSEFNHLKEKPLRLGQHCEIHEVGNGPRDACPGGGKKCLPCTDCALISFLAENKLDVNELSLSEILAASSGYRLRKAKVELSHIKDPWRLKALPDPDRNRYVKKVVFDSGPNRTQKLLLAESDDFVLVFDCDRGCVCHWFLRRPRKDVTSRQDFYILTQLEFGKDVGIDRFIRECADLSVQLYILSGLVRQYALYP